jgi:hypothetical protein
MTPNLSLFKSNQLRGFLQIDYLKSLWNVFPFEVINSYDKKDTRDRVYSTENTIMTMVYSSTLVDKTLENAVDVFKQVHDNQIERILENAKDSIEQEKASDLKNPQTRRGPKKKYKLKVPKSKTVEISGNTAAYSKARKRVSIELMQDIFRKTVENSNLNVYWHGMETYLTDGTYVQMQDTKELREMYDVVSSGVDYKEAYPQGLIQSIIRQAVVSSTIMRWPTGMFPNYRLFINSYTVYHPRAYCWRMIYIIPMRCFPWQEKIILKSLFLVNV